MDVTQVLSTGEAIQVYLEQRPRFLRRTAQGDFLVQAGDALHIITGLGLCLSCGHKRCLHSDAVERRLRS